LTDGLRNGTTREILNQADSLPLTNDLFDNDALIFNDLKSSSVALQKGDEKKWTFHFEGFPYLGIWSKSSESPFVCIEPWFGIADSTAHNQDFKEKEGIIKLEPSKIFDCNYSIEIH
jgi:galactose mutarotase-like enzyme